MTKLDRFEFNGLLNRLALTFGKDLDEATGDVYFEALKDLALSTVKVCADSHARYGRFFPKPFELRPKDAKPPVVTDDTQYREAIAREDARLEALWFEDHAEWLRQVSPKVYELGRAKGMTDGLIAHKLETYRPNAGPVPVASRVTCPPSRARRAGTGPA